MEHKISESVGEWLINHPHVLRGCTVGLIVLSAWQFYRAIKLDRLAVELIGSVQKARSEALGG